MAEQTRLQRQIEASMKKIQQEQNRLKELEKEQVKRNDKARTNRLCKRHGLLESFLPVTIDFTDEQYERFVRQHIANKHGIAVLANITGQTVEAIITTINEIKNEKRGASPAKEQKAEIQPPKSSPPTATNSTTTQRTTA